MPKGNRARGNPIVKASARNITQKRSEQEHLRDLDRTAHLYLRGYSHQQIADIVSGERQYTISRQQISKDIAKIRQMWIDSASLAYEEAIGRELAKIDELERAAWDAFERSMGDKKIELKEVVKNKGGGMPDAEKMRALTKTSSEKGATEYLKIIQWCIDKRVELLGIQTSSSASLTINWQEEARKEGVNDPTELFEQVVKGFLTKMDNGDGTRSLDGGTEAQVIDGEFENIREIPG